MPKRSESSPAEREEAAAGKRKHAKKVPLWYRIIYDERMVALVRLLGHDGMPAKDAREKVQPLVEKFGRERLQEAADEITEIVGDEDAAVARLTEEARKLAIQLIGRPRTANPQGTDHNKSAAVQTPTGIESEMDQPKTRGNSVTTLAEPEPSSTTETSPVPSAGVQEPTTQPTPTDQETESRKHEWTNYETACVAAFLNGDREFLNECLHLVELCREQVASGESKSSNDRTSTEAQTSLLADQLQRLVCEYNPLADDDTVFANLLDAALSNVDWPDLADSFLKQSAAKVVED